MSEGFDALKAQDVEDVKKQRIAALEKEIGQRKQHLDTMKLDRGEWKVYTLQVRALQDGFDGSKLEPGERRKAGDELARCEELLRQKTDECLEKYKTTDIKKLSSDIGKYENGIVKLEENLQRLEGYPVRKQGSQSGQGQNDHIQQRVKEPGTGYMAQQKKEPEPVQPPDGQEQGRNTVLTVTNFQSQREKFRQEHNAKLQEKLQKKRSPEGREM